jgi:hypothetical protein
MSSIHFFSSFFNFRRDINLLDQMFLFFSEEELFQYFHIIVLPGKKK